MKVKALSTQCNLWQWEEVPSFSFQGKKKVVGSNREATKWSPDMVDLHLDLMVY